jgi:hypothetical protein
MHDKHCRSDDIEYTNSSLKFSHHIPAGCDDVLLTKLTLSIQYENDGVRQLYVFVNHRYLKGVFVTHI